MLNKLQAKEMFAPSKQAFAIAVGEGYRQVLALRHAKLNVNHVADGVALKQPGQNDAARHGNAQHGEHRLQGPALNVAHEHAHGGGARASA